MTAFTSTPTNLRLWSLMFWAAAAFNFVIGFPIWFLSAWTYQISFIEAMTTGAVRHWADFGFAVALVGLGYAMVARDVTSNRGIVWLGILAKLFDMIVLSWRAIHQIAHSIVLIPASIDAVFVVLFVLFLRTGIGLDGDRVKNRV